MLEVDDTRLDTCVESSFEPVTQGLEMQTDFDLHFLWEGWELRSHESRDAEGDRTSTDTSLPVLDECVEAFRWVFDLRVELLGSSDCVLAVRLENGCGQACLRWEVVMDAWFLDVDRFGDIGIAKSRISSVDHQGFRHFQDAFCGFSVHTK